MRNNNFVYTFITDYRAPTIQLKYSVQHSIILYIEKFNVLYNNVYLSSVPMHTLL